MFNNHHDDELEMYNDPKGSQIHKKIEKQVKEKDKQIHPNDVFAKKMKGLKKSSHYKRSMVDNPKPKKVSRNSGAASNSSAVAE